MSLAISGVVGAIAVVSVSAGELFADADGTITLSALNALSRYLGWYVSLYHQGCVPL